MQLAGFDIWILLDDVLPADDLNELCCRNALGVTSRVYGSNGEFDLFYNQVKSKLDNTTSLKRKRRS